MRGTKASIEELIANQEEKVNKAKERLDTENAKLKELLDKKEEENKKELLKAIETSGKSAEEILTFLQS